MSQTNINTTEYGRLHRWVRSELGSARYCERCGFMGGKRYEWANYSKSYRWELSDWLSLCVTCHRKWDSEIKRGASKKTHCKRGHPLSPWNVYIDKRHGGKTCKACNFARQAKRRASLRAV